jgi:hypothetical protein
MQRRGRNRITKKRPRYRRRKHRRRDTDGAEKKPRPYTDAKVISNIFVIVILIQLCRWKRLNEENQILGLHCTILELMDREQEKTC